MTSEDPNVHRLVTLIADTVTAEGGYVHPELIVRHDGASLWLELPRALNPHLVGADGKPLDKPHPDAAPLLVVPNGLHIPVSDLDWEPHDTRLRYRAQAEHLSSAQRTILDAMVELFNTLDKVRVIGQAYAPHALENDPELFALIRAARPEFGTDNAKGRLPGEASPALSVVNSRLRTEMGEAEEGPIGYFMPMIDMLNHHPYGSRYRRTDGGDWRIDIHHPEPDDQVFVRYNRADSLGVALGLGYLETATRFVASVACRVAVAGLGTIDVPGVSGQRRRLPAPTLNRTDDGWQVSALVLEPERLENLRTLLLMPLMSVQPDRGAAANLRSVDEFLAAVLEANTAYYERLLARCTPPFLVDSEPDLGADPGQRALFAGVSAHQLHLLGNIAARLDALASA